MDARASFDGIEVKRLRAQLGWTQARLAREAGVTEPTINRFELGKRSPHPATVAQIRLALERGLRDHGE